MKQVINAKFRSFCFLISLCFFQTMAWAQDTTQVVKQHGTTTTETTTTNYGEPWMWIVGGVVLLLIIVLAVRGNSNKSTSSDTVRVTKTVERDSD